MQYEGGGTAARRTEEDNEQEGCVRISNHQVVHLQYVQLKINKTIKLSEKKRHRLGYLHKGPIQGRV